MTTPPQPAIATAPVRLPDNHYLRKAVDAELPQYQDALDLEHQADEWLANLTPPPVVPPEIDPYANPGGITEEWLTAIRAHETAHGEWEARRRILLQFRQKATAVASGILESNWNRLLSALHRDLLAILDVAACVADELGPATTAQQAIAGDVGAAWKRLTGLADEYRAVRDAQEFCVLRLPRTYLISSRPGLGGEPHASELYLRNLDDLWPDWRNPNAIARVNLDGTKPRLEPWPIDETELLLWLVRSPARPWVPTTFEIDQLWRERRDRRNPTSDEQPDTPAGEPYNSRLAGPALASQQRIAPQSEIQARRAELAQLKGTTA